MVKKPDPNTDLTIEGLFRLGPYGVIGFCLYQIVQLFQRTLDQNAIILLIILVGVMIFSFFQDRYRLKSFADLEEIKIKSEEAKEKHKIWTESMQSYTEDATARGKTRMTITRTFLSIRNIIRKDIEDRDLTEEQSEYASNLIERLEDLEKSIPFM